MSMNIVVCVKRTPASTSVALDASGKVQTAGLPHAINPFDEYAVEEAVRLKEKFPGSKVTVVTLGTPDSEEVLRAALALGCDEAALLTDPAFEDSDTWGTSYLLAQAIKKIGGVQLALFGKQTNDGESGHVPGQAAAWLDWPSALMVRKFAEVSETEAVVERLMEDGVDTLKLKLPAVVGVTKEINEPRLPSLKGKMAAKKAPIARWGAADLQAAEGPVGLSAAGTEVAGMAPVPPRPAGSVIPGESPEEKAKNLVSKLKEAKFI